MAIVGDDAVKNVILVDIVEDSDRNAAPRAAGFVRLSVRRIWDGDEAGPRRCVGERRHQDINDTDDGGGGANCEREGDGGNDCETWTS